LTNPTEAQTRRELIDPALKRAGWDLNNPDQVGFEIPVDDVDPAAWQALQTKLRTLGETGVPYDAQFPAGITDYALYRENGQVLAVVEPTSGKVTGPICHIKALSASARSDAKCDR
jgi:type I restriction enzyme R subunit